MAYKFQIGAARLSGSIIQSDGSLDARATTLDSLDNSSGGITNAGAIAGATTIDGSGDLTMGTITMTGFTVDADGDTVAKTVAVPDDGTIGNASRADMLTLAAAAVTVKNDADFNVAKAEGLQLAGVAVTSTAAELNLLDAIPQGSIVYGNSSAESARLAVGGANTVLKSDGSDISYGAVVNADVSASAAIAFSKMEDLPAAQIVVGSALNVATKVALSGDATISNAGALTLAAAQTNVESITNNSLVLEGNGNIKLDLQNSGVAKFLIGSDDKLVLNTSGVTIPGNLTVQGTTTTIDSTTINVSRSFTFEGTASDFETTFGYGATGAPIQDITVVLPEYSSSAGAHSVKAAVIAAGSSAANYAAAALVTAEEFKILDGGTSDSSVDIDDADQFIINDGGTMLQTAMSDLKSYVGSGISETVKNLSGNNTPVAGVNYYASDLTATQTVTLPASADMSVGQKVRIKAPSDCSNTVKVVINRDGTQLMDGSLESISLESPFAAVELVYVAANAWRIF